MEGMNLAKLEEVVKKMLGNLQEMKRENAALQIQLESKNNKLAELESKVKAMTSTQDEVSSRVTNLLSTIEEWEKNADVAPPDELPVEQDVEQDEEPFDSQNDRDEVVESKGGGLFSLGE